MNYYSLESKFDFGKYNQKTLKEVIEIDKSYVEWCLINVHDFSFDANLVSELFLNRETYLLSKEALIALSKKLVPPADSVDDHLDEDDLEDYEMDSFDDYEDDYGTSGEKYGWYNGFSDDVIDDAFEGDPSLTWNVD